MVRFFSVCSFSAFCVHHLAPGPALGGFPPEPGRWVPNIQYIAFSKPKIDLF